MEHRTAVVSGASIAGLSTAASLRRSGWAVTVLERASAFRDGGQNVDVRGVGHEVLARMGLEEALRERRTTETGTVLVDEHGRTTAELPTDGPDAATAELEVLRGDFARALLDALPEGVDVRYGRTITDVRDEDPGAAVVVTTDVGDELRADLLVVAEGVRSSTRGLVFPDEDVEVRDLGIAMVFGTVPRTASDDDTWRWLTTTGGRQVHLRPDPYGTTRAILALARSGGLAHLGRDELLDRLRAEFADAGWAAPRVLEGFASSDDLYVDDLAQVRMRTWRAGRVVCVGDAGWCVTPLGGGGATLALVGGYVLAAELAGHDEQEEALAAYEAWMRPLVDDVQGLPRGIDRFAFPETRSGLAARRAFDALLLRTPLRPLTRRFTEVAGTDQELPAPIA